MNLPGAGKPPNVQGLCNWIYWVWNAAAWAKELHSVIHKGINQQNGARLLRYCDWLFRYLHPKLEWLKICATCCVNGRHRINILNIKISWQLFVRHYPWNVLAKFYENLLNLVTGPSLNYHSILLRKTVNYHIFGSPTSTYKLFGQLIIVCSIESPFKIFKSCMHNHIWQVTWRRWEKIYSVLGSVASL